MARTADRRVYRTVGGDLVSEGDPAGAFLAYEPGAAIDGGDVEQYAALGDAPSAVDVARSALLAREERALRQPAQFMHERAMTEAADEMRAWAARGEQHPELARGRTVATRRVFRAEDGTLVGESDPAAVTLAYPVGAIVADQDVDAYRKLDPADSTEDATKAEPLEKSATGTSDESTKQVRPEKSTAGTKMARQADNK
jgi:hypothetical protein